MTIVRSKALRASIVIASLLVFGWGIGLVSYAQLVPASLGEKEVQTDAIVVLTGGSGRIDEGVRLLAQGRADQLFISGMDPAVNISNLIASDEPNRGALLEKISGGSEAEDTPGNAVETAKWSRANNVKSIRLVTAAYHMPRALSELRHAMPDSEIIAHPVFPEQVKADWWRYPGTASLLAREYTKYLFSMLRNRLTVSDNTRGGHTTQAMNA